MQHGSRWLRVAFSNWVAALQPSANRSLLIEHRSTPNGMLSMVAGSTAVAHRAAPSAQAADQAIPIEIDLEAGL